MWNKFGTIESYVYFKLCVKSQVLEVNATYMAEILKRARQSIALLERVNTIRIHRSRVMETVTDVMQIFSKTHLSVWQGTLKKTTTGIQLYYT